MAGESAQFVWVKFGDMNVPEHAKGKIFNTNCDCNILTDAVRQTAKRMVEDYARKRDAQLKQALAEVNYESEQLQAKIGRREGGEATEEETAMLEEYQSKQALRQQQLEVCVCVCACVCVHLGA